MRELRCYVMSSTLDSPFSPYIEVTDRTTRVQYGGMWTWEERGYFFFFTCNLFLVSLFNFVHQLKYMTKHSKLLKTFTTFEIKVLYSLSTKKNSFEIFSFLHFSPISLQPYHLFLWKYLNPNIIFQTFNAMPTLFS